MHNSVSILPLSVESLSFAVEGKVLLDSVSLTMARGGITMVVGPNGAGKSLLLRLCHGLLTPSGGRVGWAAEDGILAGRKRHAMVFQRPVMLRRSARANLDHALAAAGLDARDRDEKIAEVLSRFGLTDLAARPARLLSGGEQQRLAIARAWALAPEVIFLDEPCSQLDPGAMRQIEAMLAGLRAEGVTLLMTTHDLGQARRLADHVIFLNHGRIVEHGPAGTFFEKPETQEAQAFLVGELLW